MGEDCNRAHADLEGEMPLAKAIQHSVAHAGGTTQAVGSALATQLTEGVFLESFVWQAARRGEHLLDAVSWGSRYEI